MTIEAQKGDRPPTINPICAGSFINKNPAVETASTQTKPDESGLKISPNDFPSPNTISPMLDKIWRFLKQLIQRLFGTNPTIEPTPPPPAPTLTDAEYEAKLMELLEGVNQGWGIVRGGGECW